MPQQFDPTKYTNETLKNTEVPTVKPATQFDARQYVTQTVDSATESSSEEQAVQPSKVDQRLEEAKEGYVTIPELRGIIEKYNLPSEDLEQMKDYAVFYGAKVPGHVAPVVDALGFLGELTGSFAQKYSVWKQPDAARGALDELRELARGRKETGRVAAEFGGSLLLPAGVARFASTPQRMMGLAAATSIGQNVAQSRTGEELTGVTESITTGLGMTGLLMGLGRLISRRATDGTKQVVDSETGRVIPKEQIDEAREVQAVLREEGQQGRIRMQEEIESYNRKPATIKQQTTMNRFLTEWAENPKADQRDAFMKAVTGEGTIVAGEADAQLIPLLSRKEQRQLRKLGDAVAPEDWDGSGAEYLANRKFMVELGRLQRQVGADSLDDLRKMAKEEGPPFLSRQYKRVKESNHLRNYIQKERLAGLDEWSQFRKGVNQLIDVKPLARQLDNKYGSSFEQTIDSISEKLNRISYLRASSLRELGDLRKATNAAGVEPSTVFHALESGNATGAMPPELYGKWKDYWDSLLEGANELGLPIQRIENYAPNMRPDSITYSAKLRQLYDGIGSRASAALSGDSIEDYRKVVGITTKGKKGKSPESQAARMIAEEMETLLGEFPDSPEQFQRLYGVLRNPQSVESRMITRARAAISRQDEGIPEYFKETNIYELAKQWTSNTYRHAALRDEIAELNQFRKFATDINDTWTAEYVDKLTRDILGTRTDVLGKDARLAIKRAEIQLNDAAVRLREEGQDWKAEQLERLTYIPEVMKMMSQSIYPNLLGLSPRAAFQNAISAPIMNIPELGINYGGRKALSAARKALTGTEVEIEVTPELAQWLSGKLKLGSSKQSKRLDRLVEAGLLKRDGNSYQVNTGAKFKTSDSEVILGANGVLPAQWTGELVSQLRNELKDSATYQASADLIESWTQKSMALFEASERVARMQTYHLANEVAEDLVAGRSGAVNWLRDISSPSYGREIRKALKEGNSEKVTQLTQRYFQSTNMFNYDRANMSAYGRYMGPLFSTFTKWPTAIAGRVVQELYDRKGAGAAKLGKQLLAPLMLAAGVDALLPSAEESPRRNVLIGQGGFRGITPASSLKGYVRGEFATPPIAQAMGAIIDPLSDMDEDTPGRVSKALQRGATLFVPGANILKLTGETIPQLMGVNVRKDARSSKMKGKGKLEQQLIRTLREVRGMGRR